MTDIDKYSKLLLKCMHKYQIENDIKLNCFYNTLFFVDHCNKKKKLL